jgi:UDP-glucose 4-epimerase
MKCLVLGGGGFLGSHVCDALLKEGWHVRIFEKEWVNRENAYHFLSGVEWVEGDFTNQRHLKEIVKNVDFVIHCICTTLPPSSNENPVYDISSNVLPTIYLLEAIRNSDVKKIVFFSSGGTIYGLPKLKPIPEGHQTDPLCSYGIQKLVIEKYLGLYHHLYGLDYRIIRVSNAYGERQRPHHSQGAVTVFLYKALKGQEIEIWGDGSVVRDYVYVSDVADAVVALLKYSGKHKLFNISSGVGLSVRDLIEKIEIVTGCRTQVRLTQGRAFDVSANVLDNSLARKELHWNPLIGFEEGLKRTMAYLLGLK